jgi:hypothetical protein
MTRVSPRIDERRDVRGMATASSRCSGESACNDALLRDERRNLDDRRSFAPNRTTKDGELQDF